jgi:hypothetical protein
MWNGNELVNPILIKSFDGYHTRHHSGVMTADKANNVYVFKGMETQKVSIKIIQTLTILNLVFSK